MAGGLVFSQNWVFNFFFKKTLKASDIFFTTVERVFIFVLRLSSKDESKSTRKKPFWLLDVSTCWTCYWNALFILFKFLKFWKFNFVHLITWSPTGGTWRTSATQVLMIFSKVTWQSNCQSYYIFKKFFKFFFVLLTLDDFSGFSFDPSCCL